MKSVRVEDAPHGGDYSEIDIYEDGAAFALAIFTRKNDACEDEGCDCEASLVLSIKELRALHVRCGEVITKHDDARKTAAEATWHARPSDRCQSGSDGD